MCYSNCKYENSHGDCTIKGIVCPNAVDSILEETNQDIDYIKQELQEMFEELQDNIKIVEETLSLIEYIKEEAKKKIKELESLESLKEEAESDLDSVV